jgi:hypothetical protein
MSTMQRFYHDHTDIIQVVLAHLGAITVTFLDVENALKIISLVSAIGYTLWKWRKEYLQNKKKK